MASPSPDPFFRRSRERAIRRAFELAASRQRRRLRTHSLGCHYHRSRLRRDMDSSNTEYYQISDKHVLRDQSGRTLLLGMIRPC